MNTIKQVFDHHFNSVKIDGSLGKLLYRFRVWFVNQNSDHLEFFGSNLLGVHVLQFRDKDHDRFFNEILNIDYDLLKEDLYKLDSIDPSYKVSSDVFNLSCFYLMHRYYSESSLTDSVKQNAYIDVALLFYYRCTQALMSAYFKYPADPKLAEAAFARLSHKFLIKRLGTWGKVIEFRAKELFEKESIHLKTIKGYNDDAMIIYMINDSQGRIRSMMKSYAEVFYAAYEENDRVGSTTSVVTDMEGKESVKEKTKSIESIVTYMRQTLIDEDSFVKKEMVDVIYSVNKNTSTRMIDQTLRYMCRSYNDSKKMKQIDDFVSSVVVYSFYLIDQEIKPKSYRDLPVILTKLKNLYLSTRTIDEEMIRIRDMGQSIVNDSVAGQTYHKSLLMATRTSLLLYISLRALISKM
jgi:hypothetical protein